MQGGDGLAAVAQLGAVRTDACDVQSERTFLPGDGAAEVGDREMHGAETQGRREIRVDAENGCEGWSRVTSSDSRGSQPEWTAPRDAWLPGPRGTSQRRSQTPYVRRRRLRRASEHLLSTTGDREIVSLRVAARAARPKGATMSGAIAWRNDFDGALAEAGDRDLPVLLDFFKPT